MIHVRDKKLRSSRNDSLFLISIPTPTLYTLNFTQVQTSANQNSIKINSQLSQEGGDWEAQCLLPASHPWPDSPSIDSSGHMWFVSNRYCLPKSIDVHLFDKKVPRLLTRHTARLPPPLLRRAQGSLGRLLLHG